MARELIINISCDFCRSSITEEEAHAGEVILGGSIYHLDLCDPCSMELTQKLTPKPKAEAKAAVAAVKTHSVTPMAERNLPCDICGVKCKNERGLKFHKFRMHPGSVSKVK